MKSFFRLVRLVLGPLLLLKERLTRPQGIARAVAQQEQVDTACQRLALYQFQTCPFCIRIRQEMRRLSLKIELRDAQHSAENRRLLTEQGGSGKVPCLQIRQADGSTKWLYDSRQIISYLQQQFA